MAGSWTTSSDLPRTSPPFSSAFRFAANRSRLSRTAANAVAWPCAASAVPRASRCESICISVAVAVAAAPCDAARLSSMIMSSASTSAVPNTMPRTDSCLATGMSPISGSFHGAIDFAVAARSCSITETEASGS